PRHQLRRPDLGIPRARLGGAARGRLPRLADVHRAQARRGDRGRPGARRGRGRRGGGDRRRTMSAVVVAVVYGVPYWLRTRTLARAGRAVPAWRRLCFAAGVLVLVAAVAPPIGTVADRRLWVHMSEHLMIGDIASLLVVLGLTGSVIAPVL